jgi:protein Mpv17
MLSRARTIMSKVAVNQIMMTPINSALFMTWTAHFEAYAAGRRDWAQVREELKPKLVEKVPSLVLAANLVWIPVNAFNFAFVPAHLRIPFMSTVSVLWGAYLSFKTHS